MNFTLISQQYSTNSFSNVTPKHKIIIENEIEYLLCPNGTKLAIWSLIDLIKSDSEKD